ncbi:hypothetical protein [Micromonospora sp. NPDC005171]|uniref:hypothetical protein n=1 Tax=Micromonospora sp. NPDC005171 TaxID=3156866 RepID=UPI0033B0B3EE
MPSVVRALDGPGELNRDPIGVEAVRVEGDLLREGVPLLGLADRAEVRDAAAAWTGRVNTVTARTDRVDVCA